MSQSFIEPNLTDALVREQTVQHIVATLRELPDGWTVGFQAPGYGPRSAGSGAVGPNGAWNMHVGYWVWGYGDLTGDQVFDEFVRIWDSWGWIESAEAPESRTRAAYGYTPDHYEFKLMRYTHDGVGMSWISPYYPASGSDYGGPMPSIITKDGPQSYVQPVRD